MVSARQPQSAELSLESVLSACILLSLKLTLLSAGAQHSEIPYYQSDHCKGFFFSSITLSLYHFPFCHSFLLLYSEFLHETSSVKSIFL